MVNKVNKMQQKIEKIKNFLIKNYKWIALFICIVSLLFLIEDVMDDDIIAFDEKGYYIVQKYFISDTITPFAKCITNFANMYWLIGVSIFLIVFPKTKICSKSQLKTKSINSNPYNTGEQPINSNSIILLISKYFFSKIKKLVYIFI